MNGLLSLTTLGRMAITHLAQGSLRAGRPEQPRQAELDGHRVDGGDVAMRQRPGARHGLPTGTLR
jgi:hypothetical protein